MTTTTRNEAAERLLNELQENPLPGARHSYSIVRDRLPAALAAERRATVERIRLEFRLSAFAANARYKGSAYEEVIRILDTEAAR